MKFLYHKIFALLVIALLFICTEKSFSQNISNENYNRDSLQISNSEIETQTEISDYLYAMPAYPNPAKNYVRGKFYYSYPGGLDKTDINVYDNFGTKIGSKKDFEIEPIESEFLAELKWNCSEMATGVYIIVITSPNGLSRIMPVLVMR